MSVNIGINIQRSPNRINQQLREAGVGGKYPKLLLDFADNYYLANGGSKTLANAVTHARAGNATMTDGYGPELVTNGGFDSDSDWTLGTGWSIAGGKAVKTAGTGDGASQSIDLKEGVAYLVSYDITRNAGGVQAQFVGGSTVALPSKTASGSYTDVLVAVSGNTSLRMFASSTFGGTIDNISVREMPVLKWGPHNLLTYSEDPSSSLTSTNDASWTTNNTLTATAQSGNQTPYARVLQTFTQKGTYVFAVETTSTTVQYLTLQTQIFDANANGVSVFDIQSGSVNTEASQHTATITATSEGFLCAIEFELDGTDLNGYLTMGLSEVSGIHRIVDPDGTESVTVTRLRSYRSDLGGMVDNPERGDSYVPTTSSARYLPRVGHHVYNGGSAWVNEGVLAESESRVNLVEHSTPDTNWTLNRVTMTENNAVSPDGTENATRINETTATNSHYIYGNTTNVTSGLNYTLSAYVKADTSTACQLLFSSTGFGSSHYANFDLSTGTVGYEAANATATIQDVGNGWYRCAITSTATATASTFVGFIVFVDNDASSSSRIPSYAGDTAQQMYVYGAQVEEASTPSSLIPTSGSSVTRAAETFTIPSANLPWPTPQSITGNVYSGTDPVNITGDHDFTPTIADDSSTKVVRVKWTQTINTGTRTRMRFRNAANSLDLRFKYYSGSGTFEEIIVTSIGLLWRQTETGIDVNISDITLEEINPLSVSIGMEGRMTYADTDSANEINFVRWLLNASNQILIKLRTNGANEGEVFFRQEENNVTSDVATAGDLYQAGVLLPFDLAQRSGSTFINGAVNGVALTANTTPTALPDLSSSDLELAQTYMGTISEFRVWDKDIGDAGLVEATNPSLEPSLSLTFEGTGTNSFVTNDWSQ